jgi:alkylhydroperoxidase family enzyme
MALDFSVKLTKQAWETRQEDIDRLREVGYSDEQVIEIVHVASYFNYINRVVDGLGGELEEWMRKEK